MLTDCLFGLSQRIGLHRTLPLQTTDIDQECGDGHTECDFTLDREHLQRVGDHGDVSGSQDRAGPGPTSHRTYDLCRVVREHPPVNQGR